MNDVPAAGHLRLVQEGELLCGAVGRLRRERHPRMFNRDGHAHVLVRRIRRDALDRRPHHQTLRERRGAERAGRHEGREHLPGFHVLGDRELGLQLGEVPN